MVLYLVRHGQTNWNVAGKLQGQSDIPLNDHGIMTARLTGEQLAHIPFTKALSSPLQRAYTTCELIIGDRPLEIEKDPDLMEISFGDYEGLCIHGEHKNVPEQQFHEHFFHHPDQYITPPNGESLFALRKRARHFIDKLAVNEQLKNDTIVATAHGAIICAILAELHQYDMAHFWGYGVPKNCSVTIIRFEKGEITIEEENKVLFS